MGHGTFETYPQSYEFGAAIKHMAIVCKALGSVPS